LRATGTSIALHFVFLVLRVSAALLLRTLMSDAREGARWYLHWYANFFEIFSPMCTMICTWKLSICTLASENRAFSYFSEHDRWRKLEMQLWSIVTKTTAAAAFAIDTLTAMWCEEFRFSYVSWRIFVPNFTMCSFLKEPFGSEREVRKITWICRIRCACGHHKPDIITCLLFNALLDMSQYKLQMHKLGFYAAVYYVFLEDL
jgi:hypothetical protein